MTGVLKRQGSLDPGTRRDEAGRRCPPASQGERPRKRTNPGLQHWEGAASCCLSSPACALCPDNPSKRCTGPPRCTRKGRREERKLRPLLSVLNPSSRISGTCLLQVTTFTKREHNKFSSFKYIHLFLCNCIWPESDSHPSRESPVF